MKKKSISPNQFQLIFSFLILLACLVQCTNQDTSKDRINEIKKQLPERYELDPEKPIEKRIENSPERIIKMSRLTGINPTAHELTPAERTIVDSAFALLPPLHKKVLKQHLIGITFINNLPVSGITLPDENDAELYHIIFNSSILNKTVSEWLTEKERSCFNKDSSPITVSVNAGSINALVFVLIHEATHIVDGATRILPKQWKNYNEKPAVPAVVANTWSNWLELLPAFHNSLLSTTCYRKGGKIFTMEEALPVYQALKRTPLVSIYSASNWHEDIAEYLTVYHLTSKLSQPYSITLRENGKLIFSYTPMESNLVKSRLEFMNLFYK